MEIYKAITGDLGPGGGPSPRAVDPQKLSIFLAWLEKQIHYYGKDNP